MLRNKLVVLALSLALTKLGADNFETDPSKYIQDGARVRILDLNGNEVPDLYWWDKNGDYEMGSDELFIDLNEDGIPDVSYKEILKMYQNSRKFLNNN